MALAVVIFPYARAEGLGRAMKDHAGWRQAVLAAATAIGASVLVADARSAAAFVLASAAAAAVAAFVLTRLPGLTGDVYGAACELLETLTLLVFVAGGNL